MRSAFLVFILVNLYGAGYCQQCGPPTVAGTTICPGSAATLTATTPGGTLEWYDAVSGGRLLATGNSYTTPALSQNTTYFVQTVIGTCTSLRTSVTVSVLQAPSVSPATICAGSTATLTATAPGGDYEWYDAASGGTLLQNGPSFTPPALNTTTTYFVQTTVNKCTTARSAVTVTVKPNPAAPTASGATICSEASVTLSATAPGGTYQWFSSPTGGTPLIISPDFTTPALKATTTYYVQSTINGCTSSRTPVTVVVNSYPPAPSASGTTICSGTAATLTVTSAGGTYQWYAVPSRGKAIAGSSTFTTPILTRTTTYYVDNSMNGCTSPRTAVTVTVNPIPEAPVAPGVKICAGATATLTAVSPGGTYSWYDAPQNGNLVATGSSFSTPALGNTTTWYVQTTMNDCTSSRTPVTVTVAEPLPPPQVSGATVCSGETATLTATGTGDVFEWYDAPSGGKLLLVNPQYTPQPLSATRTFYVQTSIRGCNSERTAVTVTVNPVPRAPVVSGTTICPGATATLTAAAQGGGSYEWYNAPTGGNLLSSQNVFTTPALTTNTTYYVQTSLNGCISPRTPVTVSIRNVVNPAFRYPSATYCLSGANPTPEILTPDGGTFSAAPMGLVFISNSTGEVDLRATQVGTYLITFVANDLCRTTTTSSFKVTETADASFSYAGPYCQGADSNPPATFAAGASAGSFTSSPAGLVFSSDGSLNLKESRPGNYTVTNTIPASGLCPATSSTATVEIIPKPLVDAGPDQTLFYGSPVLLSGSSTSARYVWSGGSGTFSNPAVLNPVYTHGVNETRATLYLTTSGPGPCAVQTDSVTITLSAPPPSVSGDTICAGTTATLKVSDSEGMFEWYDAPSGGNLLLTNPTFVTPPLTVTKMFYVQRVIAGIASSRTPVTVSVNPLPSPPEVADITICAGSTATLTVTSSGGNYQWYNAPTEGDLLASGTSFTTPVLTTTTVYYVQSTINGCTSDREAVTVTANITPSVTSAAVLTICNRNNVNYKITSNIPGTAFTWSRAALPEVINAAVTNQSTQLISEVLVTTATVPVDVTYVITPVYQSCTGASLTLVVTVDPTPVATSATSEVICNNTASNYPITFNMSGVGFSWSRQATPGISNAPVSGQKSAIIREVLTNTTTIPVDVTYLFEYSFNGCDSPPFRYVVTVNPAPAITSAARDSVCSGTAHSYTITATMDDAVFTWSRDAISNISNPAVTDRISNVINEVLINTDTSPVDVLYRINASSNGCSGPVFMYRVRVNPIPAAPVIVSNSPVCINTALNLSTAQILNATYLWTGPNGFRSAQQNPVIAGVTQANSGVYRLVVSVNGCSSPESTTTISVNELPVANAGTDQTVCVQTQGVTLSGSITGGTSTGIWSSAGTGTFSPANTSLNATYIPSSADRSAGLVALTLTSTSPDNCTPSVSTVTITFEQLPVVDAGPDQDVCSQNHAVILNGSVTVVPGATWSSSGNGTFSPSTSSLNAVYIPGSSDISIGKVTLTLSASGDNVCLPISDQLTVNIIPPPVIVMEPDLFIPLNQSVRLNPSVNDPNVQYLWTPNINLDDDKIRNPLLTGVNDQTYTLRVTDSRGCISEQKIVIDVLMPILIPNAFTPNGDGVNDVWNIAELQTYPGNTVNIYNRYGVKIFSSVGYEQSWDGTYNGEPAPVGTYYYIINTQFPGMVYSGSITILR